ncbi:MAG TPA: iron ABC transporter permease [Tissierellaceae bacterium]|nr:iron ABC transporter permease [Tissierellaceae bacterium]
MKKTFKILDKLILIGIAVSIILFILYPFIEVFKVSIIEDGVIDFSVFKSLGKEIKLLKNSLTLGVLSMLLSTIVSVIIAIFHFIEDKKRKKWIVMVLMLTMISPPFVSSLSYINLFGRRGLITYNLLKLNTNPYGLTGIVLMQSLGFISMNALLIIGFLNGLDKSVINSARSLGAKTDNIIIDILLPLMKPVITVVLLLTFVRSLADFGTPTIIGGAYNVLATEGYLAVIAEGNIRRAAVINVLILIPALIVFVLYSKSFGNVTMNNQGVGDSSVELERKGILFHVFRLVSILFIFWLLLQYGSIILSAFTRMKKGKMIFTMENFINSRPYISDSFIRSIVYSLIAGVFSSFIGHILQYYIQLRDMKWMKSIDFIATMPYIVPGTFFGLGYILAFNSTPLRLTGTATIVILNVLFKQLPFSTKIGYASISQINKELTNSVRDLGGSELNELTDLVLPVSKDGLYISFVNGFTSTMTTIGSIIFLVYPTQKLATLVMFDVIQSGKYEIGSVIALYIILTCLLVNGIYYLILNLRRGKYASRN